MYSSFFGSVNGLLPVNCGSAITEPTSRPCARQASLMSATPLPLFQKTFLSMTGLDFAMSTPIRSYGLSVAKTLFSITSPLSAYQTWKCAPPLTKMLLSTVRWKPSRSFTPPLSGRLFSMR